MKTSIYILKFIILNPPKTYTQNNIYLTKSKINQLQNLTITTPKKKHTKPKLKLKIINQNNITILQTPPNIQSKHSKNNKINNNRNNTH